MNRFMKKATLCLSVVCMTLGMSACAGGTSGGGNNKPANSVGNLSMDDIDWNIEKAISGNQEKVDLVYTNNSKYDIYEFHVYFEWKDDITSEELSQLDDIKSQANKTDEEIQETEIHAYNKSYCPKGDTLKDANVFYTFGLYFPTKDIMDLTVPSKADIAYLDGDQLRLVHYSFDDKEMIEDQNSPIKAYQWEENDISKKIPTLKCDVGHSTYDEDDKTFKFYGYGIEPDEFKSYLEECKEKGFDQNEEHPFGENTYSASDGDGYTLELSYNKRIKELSIEIGKSEE